MIIGRFSIYDEVKGLEVGDIYIKTLNLVLESLQSVLKQGKQ